MHCYQKVPCNSHDPGAGNDVHSVIDHAWPDKKRIISILDQVRASGDEMAMAYLSINKDSGSAYVDLGWLPKDMEKEKLQPEMPHSLGAPWLFIHKSAMARHGSELIPFPGIGQFLIGVGTELSFPAYVFAWPMVVAKELGQTPDSMFDYISGLGQSEAVALASEHLFWMELDAGRTCWIPYGWDYVLISRLGHADNALTSILCIPFFCFRMASKLHEQSLDILLETANGQLKKERGQIWSNLGPAFVSWLERLRSSVVQEETLVESASVACEEKHSSPAKAESVMSSATGSGKKSPQAKAKSTAKAMTKMKVLN